MIAVTARFAGFYTNSSHNCRKGVIFHNLLECILITPGLRIVEPCLNIFAGRARAVAGRHKIHVNGALAAPVAGSCSMLHQVNRFGHVGKFCHFNTLFCASGGGAISFVAGLKNCIIREGGKVHNTESLKTDGCHGGL